MILIMVIGMMKVRMIVIMLVMMIVIMLVIVRMGRKLFFLTIALNNLFTQDQLCAPVWYYAQ